MKLANLPFTPTIIKKRVVYARGEGKPITSGLKLNPGKATKPGQIETIYTRDVESKQGNVPPKQSDQDDQSADNDIFDELV